MELVRCSAFTDRREDEPNGIGTPFFDTRPGRALKGAPDGCGFALTGFPPEWCREPVMYEATLEPTEHHCFDVFALCAEHARRFRTARYQVSAIWAVR